MTTTAMFCVMMMIVVAIYDGIAVSRGGINASVSFWFKSTALRSPWFAFACGFICGHLFGYMAN